MIDACRPTVPHELGHELEVAGAVLVPGNGRFEVARIGETVRADGAEIGQAQGCAEVLTDIAACLPVQELDAKTQATGDDGDLLWFDVQEAELGGQAKPSQLR